MTTGNAGIRPSETLRPWNSRKKPSIILYSSSSSALLRRSSRNHKQSLRNRSSYGNIFRSANIYSETVLHSLQQFLVFHKVRTPDYWTIFQVWSYHGLIQWNKNWQILGLDDSVWCIIRQKISHFYQGIKRRCIFSVFDWLTIIDFLTERSGDQKDMTDYMTQDWRSGQ